MQIFLTTLNAGTYTFPDLGDFTVVHPIGPIPLIEPIGEFTQEDIQLSENLLNEAIAGNIELTNEGGNQITSLADLQTADPGIFVHLTGSIDEAITGRKTFQDDRILIDSDGSATNFEIGWFDDLSPPDPDSYGMRRTDGGGVFSVMNNANFPQLFLGDPVGTGSAFVDATNNRPFNINVLDTGADDPGEVNIGIGGLRVLGSSELAPTNPLEVSRDDSVPILSFVVESDGTLTAGNTVGYEALVLADNDIPNKKYVDDAIAAGSGSEVNDLTAAVTWANVPDANITQSSVTQHEGAIDHDALLNFLADEHATPKNSIELDVGQLQLDGDVALPGNDFYYGTNDAGVKGWYAVPPASASVQAVWKFDDNTSSGNPGNGEFRYNNSTPASVTQIFINEQTENDFDAATILGALQTGNKIYIQQVKNAGRYLLVTVSGTPTDNGSWWTIPVTVDDAGTLPSDGKECGFIFFGIGSVSTPEVNDLTAAVTWANVPDANITQSSVTQHEAAINHDNLLGFVANEHIDWTVDQSATNINNANIELGIDDLTDVDVTTVVPLTGSTLNWDGTDYVPNNFALFNINGCFVDFIDDSGLDFCVTQVGSASGSAFYIAKRALGTILSPLPVTDGTKIGGYSFLAFDGATANPGYVGAEISSVAVGDQSGTNGGARMIFEVTQENTKTTIDALAIEDNGVLSVAGQTDYELLIAGNDDALVNVKYVADQLTQGDMSVLSIRRTTTLNPIPTTWTDLTWTTVDLQNNTDVIEYTGTPADEIDIKEAGAYWVAWAITADDEINIRLALDGIPIAGSEHQVGDIADAIQDLNGNSKGRAYDLAVGTLTLQVQATTGSEFIRADDCSLSIIRLAGPKGETGAQGPQGPAGTPGGSIIIQEGGVGSAAVNTLNFDGTDFDVTISGVPGNFVATIDANIPPTPLAYGAIRVESTGADQSANYNVTTPEIPLVLTGTVSNFGAGATYFSNSSGSITCNFDGVVEVMYSVPHFGNATARLSLKSVIQLNGANYGAVEYSYIRDGSGHQRDTNSGADIIAVSNGDVIRIGMRRAENSSSGGAITIEPLTSITIKRVE